MTTKVGIIGAGGMVSYHIQGFKQAGAEISAIADINEEAAQKVADKNAIPKVFGDVAEMLALGEIDAVSIIVPNKFHAPLAIQALEAGKHTFCEKPPALNAAEVEKMLAAAQKAGKTLMFNFNNRARPESYAIMEKINAGNIGTINSAQAKWCRRTGIPGFGGWFTTKALSGGGPLIDLLHMLDLAMYFMGYPKPAHVLAQTFNDFITDKNFKGPWGLPDNDEGTTDVEAAAHGLVSFETGQVCSFQISWAEMIEREEVSVTFQGTKSGGKVERLFGEDGLDETAIDTCEIYSQNGTERDDETINVEECEDMGRIKSAANFILAIEGREEPLNTPAQALTLMKVIDAAYESAASGTPVSCQ
ncbi:MAG: Gfo/Idh/MocA family oxidoreductase [Verrucomicrobiales bacterium]|jgi:predicted dehydrogenase